MSQIITQNGIDLHCSWQKELANVITDPKVLLSLLNIDTETYQQHYSARKLFPVRVPRPFVKKMEQGNFNDPLLLQVMSNQQEFDQIPGYIEDPLDEHDTPVEGLLHKYHNRVLLIVKAGCAINCRYCFRRHFPYQENSPNKVRWQQSLDYIKQNPDINEVIFSGGDPLMANDDHLAWFIENLEQITHLKRLRIHTRLPVTIPNRITKELVQALEHSRLKTIMVFHINHPNEIDDTFAKAIKPLTDAGVLLLNQSVLLANINDNSQVLCELSEALFSVGILPYYLHVLDPVSGAAHFDLPESEAIAIAKQMMANLPGYLMPKLVREVAGEMNKTAISLS